MPIVMDRSGGYTFEPEPQYRPMGEIEKFFGSLDEARKKAMWDYVLPGLLKGVEYMGLPYEHTTKPYVDRVGAKLDEWGFNKPRPY